MLNDLLNEDENPFTADNGQDRFDQMLFKDEPMARKHTRQAIVLEESEDLFKQFESEDFDQSSEKNLPSESTQSDITSQQTEQTPIQKPVEEPNPVNSEVIQLEDLKSLKNENTKTIGAAERRSSLKKSGFANLAQTNDEESDLENFFFSQQKHYLVFTNAGKPIYSL